MDHGNVDSVMARLLANRPQLQVDEHGLLRDFGIHVRLTETLRNHVKPGNRTIETGSGLSTILFLLLGAEHTAISPDPGEPDRIRAICNEFGISTERYHPVVAFSENVLPSLPPEPPFDLAFVDGSHAFPAPQLDWYFLARRLRQGGLMIVDDAALWPCRNVVDYMEESDDWERVLRIWRFGVYRLKVSAAEATSRSWTAQPYVCRRSRVVRMLNWLGGVRRRLLGSA